MNSNLILFSIPIFVVILTFGTPEVNAHHDGISTTVMLFKGNTMIAFYQTSTACDTEVCPQQYLDLPKRDEKRFIRWCGTDTFVSVIPNGGLAKLDTCEGKGPWSISVRTLHTTGGAFTPSPHGTVSIPIHVY